MSIQIPKNDELDSVELAIKNCLVAYTKEARDKKFSKDSVWTKVLKQYLGKLGEQYGFKICASGFKDDYEPEWLFDIVWYEEIGSGVDRRLIDVPLVVESEWNPDFNCIKYDFEKLLIANASHKLMICYVHENNREKILNYFKHGISLYKHSRRGDRFMIAILDIDSHDFIFDLIIR